jgi:hypothetical protein
MQIGLTSNELAVFNAFTDGGIDELAAIVHLYSNVEDVEIVELEDIEDIEIDTGTETEIEESTGDEIEA